MLIHINDPLDKQATQTLSKLLPGHTIISQHLETADLIAKMPEIDVLVIRSATKATKEIIDAGTNLKLIARAGMGLDNVDQNAAKARNIKVINTPGANSLSVAELVAGMILSIDRFLVRSTTGMIEGKWEKKSLEGFELSGKTFGIVGFGNIGKLLSKILSGFNLKVMVYDVFEIAQETLKEYNVKQVSLEEIYSNCDIISFHVPKTEKTTHMVSDKEFEMMKKGVIIINASRGGIIDEHALLRALESEKVFGAGLDVYEEEPPKSEVYQKLFKMPNVVLTPHIGAATVEAQWRVGMDIVDRIVKEVKNF